MKIIEDKRAIKEDVSRYLVEEPKSDFDLLEIINFLKQGNLPEKLNFTFNGTLHTFLSEDERYQFALGLESAWNFLDDIWYSNYQRGL